MQSLVIACLAEINQNKTIGNTPANFMRHTLTYAQDFELTIKTCFETSGLKDVDVNAFVLESNCNNLLDFCCKLTFKYSYYQASLRSYMIKPDSNDAALALAIEYIKKQRT